MTPIAEVLSRYNVRYLLTHDGYLPECFINDLPSAKIFHFGAYSLYCFE
jgi:hypothetical protein